jgi:tetratricopeptide (TPR) repeat protein
MVSGADASTRLTSQLNYLERVNLIRLAAARPDLAYAFRHALIEDSTYQALVRADRRRLHRAVGETLEALYAGHEPPPEVAPQLARHFEECDDLERALRYYLLAGESALARFAKVEAIAHLSRAVACAERVSASAEAWSRLFTGRGRALELNAQYHEALANYQSMAQRAELLGSPRMSLAAAVAIGQLYATATVLFDPERAEHMAEAALEQARALGDEAIEAKILWNQLNLYRLSARHTAAREAGERSLAIARRLGLKEQEALATNDLIHVYTDLGRWSEAERASAEAGRLWAELSNTAMLADSLSTTAYAYALTGQFEAALRAARDAHHLAQTINDLWGQAYSLSAMVWSFWYTGQPDQALATTSECIRVGQRAGYLAVEVYDRARLAYMHLELGEAEDARALAQQALEASRGTTNVGVSTGTLVVVRLDLLAGDVARAAERLAAIQSALDSPPHWEVAPVLQVQAEVALAQGDAQAALEAAQAHVAGLRALGLRAALPEALSGLARALLMVGRAGEAQAGLVEALELAQSMGAQMLAWPVLYQLGRLEAEHGASAEPHWAPARDIVQAIAERLPSPGLRASFLARPDITALFAA